VVVDLFLVYQFIRKLVKPFKDWDAHELGIIDDQGKVLKRRKDLTTGDERKAFGLFDLMILNLKKLLAKVPGGQTKLATYAAALWLIREFKESDEDVLTEQATDDIIEESMKSFLEYYQAILLDESFEEEMMAVGTGAIAGLGVGPDGEPGITKKVAKKYKDKNKKDQEMLLTFKEASLKMRIAARGNVADAIMSYAKKSGGIDKDDMMDVAIAIETGDLKKAKTLLNKMDTDPRDWIRTLLKKKNFKL
jgi:hypothetical protein